MKRLLPFLILLAMGCSNPTDSPLELANAFQKAIERKDYEKAYNFIDESLKEQTIPDDLELFFNSEESVLSTEASGRLLPVVANYPTFRIIEFHDSNPSDSCGITDIVVVRNRDNVWSVVWADHISSEVTLSSTTHPFSTRNRFYQGGNYNGENLSDVLPSERFVQLRNLKLKLFQNLLLNNGKYAGGTVLNDGREIIRDAQSPKLLFYLGVRQWVEDAIEYYPKEIECIEIPAEHDDILIALSQYLILENKDNFWKETKGDFEGIYINGYIGNFWGYFRHASSPRPLNYGSRHDYESRLKSWRGAVAEEKSAREQFMQDIQKELKNGRPDSHDLIKAIKLLAMVKDKDNPEYIATKALADDKRKRQKTQNPIHQLTAAELQICEQSFSGMRDFYEPFELEEFCSCVFHSSAGFETFLDSPGEYLKENEDCLERYLFRPASMSEEDIESYWRGVDKASQPVTRDGFATSCAKGLLMLPEFKEIDFSSAQEFCLCIYDEAEGKGLAMDDLMTSAGDDIAEACGHLISP